MMEFPGNLQIHNLAPDQFVFWLAPKDRFVSIGPDQDQVPLPSVPLPIMRDHADDDPSDNAIGEGAYDYLRRFPDCQFNLEYAQLLRDAYPHYLADMAAHVVMLDAKDVDPAYVHRKLTALKILRLLDPTNQGLLLQLCHGFYDLALTFSELTDCHRNLIAAMRFGLDLIKLAPDNRAVLHILADIDMLLCDYPAAAVKWEQLKSLTDDPDTLAMIDGKLAKCRASDMPERSLVEELESVGQAMQLYAAKNYELASIILEQLDEAGSFLEEFPSAEFYYFLGMCRIKKEDKPGAHVALIRALELDPDHQPAREALDGL